MKILFFWLPAKLGGLRSDPQDGVRCQIRWMKHLEASLSMSRDAILVEVSRSEPDGYWIAECSLISDVPSASWLKAGVQIELYNATQLLGVGVIVAE